MTSLSSTASGLAFNANAYSFFNDSTTTNASLSTNTLSFAGFASEDSSTDVESLLVDYCWKNDISLSSSQKAEALSDIDTTGSLSEINRDIESAINSLNLNLKA
jgi:hypothetical protein